MAPFKRRGLPLGHITAFYGWSCKAQVRQVASRCATIPLHCWLTWRPLFRLRQYSRGALQQFGTTKNGLLLIGSLYVQVHWSKAYANLRQAKSRVATRYNANRRAHVYKVGDTVLYRQNVLSSKARNISAKLSMKWSQPVVIAKILRPNVVLLANPGTGVIVRRAHVSQLKPYCT